MLYPVNAMHIIYAYMTSEEELYSKAVETGIHKLDYVPEIDSKNAWYMFSTDGKEIEGLTRIEIRTSKCVNVHFFMQKKHRKHKFEFAEEILKSLFKDNNQYIKAFIEFPDHRDDIIKFLDALGFTREGKLEKCCIYEHYVRDLLIYGISKEMYMNKKDSK